MGEPDMFRKQFNRFTPSIFSSAAFTLVALASIHTYAQDNQYQGSGLSYDYAELRFVDREFDNSSADGDGFLFGGSFEIAPKILVTASYEDLEYDGGTDASTLSIGGGYVHPLEEKVDLVGYASLIRTDIDGGDDDTGFGLAGGVRALVAPNVEARALGNYVDVDNSDTYFELGADYWITEQFTAGLTVTIGGDADTITFGGRWFFNNQQK